MTKVPFLLATLLLLGALLFPDCNCKPTPENQQEFVPKANSSKFAEEAADALDNTIWFLKNSLSNIIEDSSRINNMLASMSERLKKLPPMETEQYNLQNDGHLQLEHSIRQANKTLLETLK